MAEEDSLKRTDETTIAELRELVSEFVHERNWEQYHTPKSLSEAISIESAELLENFLFQPDSHLPADIEKVTDEMADIFVYLMSLANTLQLKSFSEEVYRKMIKNRQKYPIEKFSGNNYSKQ
ncbi:hypothetical protein NEF87_004568 [Candidatus Lokiarchaeum ossiferum]|uniref:Nucleotide pyrophosphohydrolase n=1 Tax=Candidatus Lokiarchaeum ossiferum TaxID=2951803 RepID=A0ABY6HXM8_9ARCH|nr:hypothetical protein NEF87_004568 [Candidatus Lokiarchaeum sp. B-35]